MGSTLAATYERLGSANCTFSCCDTQWQVDAVGVGADGAVAAAKRTAERLETQLNAFDDASAISQLNAEGVVTNRHVAALVRRGLEYYDRTAQVFDIHQGRVEHDLKAYLRGEESELPERFDTGTVSVTGDTVKTELSLDLNGLAKGYIVDRAAETLGGVGRRGFVNGGGDMSPPTGLVAVESPYGDDTPLTTLDTSWAVASSGGYRRERAGTNHIYDPTTERLGSRHELVTVVARRDCMEADAVATTLAALPLKDATALAEQWPALEALIIHDGVFHRTTGFNDHVLDR